MSSVSRFLDCLSIWSLLLRENTLKVSTSSHFVYPAHLLKVTVLHPLIASVLLLPPSPLQGGHSSFFCFPTPFLFPVGTCTSSVSTIRSICVSMTSIKTPINSVYFCLKEVYLSVFFSFKNHFKCVILRDEAFITNAEGHWVLAK